MHPCCCCDLVSESKVISMSCCDTAFLEMSGVLEAHHSQRVEASGRSGQGCRLCRLAAAGMPSLSSSFWQQGSVGTRQPQEGCCRAFSFWEPGKKEDDD